MYWWIGGIVVILAVLAIALFFLALVGSYDPNELHD
jgi:hypothetical protein